MHLTNNFSIRHQHGRKCGWLCVIIAQSYNPFLLPFAVCHITGIARIVVCHARKMHIPSSRHKTARPLDCLRQFSTVCNAPPLGIKTVYQNNSWRIFPQNLGVAVRFPHRLTTGLFPICRRQSGEFVGNASVNALS